MRRVIVLEIEGVLRPADSPPTNCVQAPWASILSNLLESHPDVRLVISPAQDDALDVQDLPLVLGPLFGRVVGSTMGIRRHDGLIASVRSIGPLEHLVLMVDASSVEGMGLNVVTCDPSLGVSSADTSAAVVEWLGKTALHDPRSAGAASASTLGTSGPASPTGNADVILYLDLDGVVQHESVLFHPKRGIYMSPAEAPARTLFEWVPILVDILAPYPSVRLVLSSSWCVRPGYGKTLKRLPLELRTRFVGGTYHREFHGSDPWGKESFLRKPRGLQVLEDVERRKPRRWLALDDDVEDWPESTLQHLIACDGRTGLSSVRVQYELKTRLAKLLASVPAR